MISLFHTFYLLHIVLFGLSPHLSRNVMKSRQMYESFPANRNIFVWKRHFFYRHATFCPKFCLTVPFSSVLVVFRVPSRTKTPKTLRVGLQNGLTRDLLSVWPCSLTWQERGVAVISVVINRTMLWNSGFLLINKKLFVYLQPQKWGLET